MWNFERWRPCVLALFLMTGLCSYAPAEEATRQVYLPLVMDYGLIAPGLGYEQSISPYQSLSLEAYGHFWPSGWYNGQEDSIYGLGGVWRWYVHPVRPLNGWFVGAVIGMRLVHLKVSAPSRMADLWYSGVGFLCGYQWTLQSNWVLTAGAGAKDYFGLNDPSAAIQGLPQGWYGGGLEPDLHLSVGRKF